MPNRLVLWGTLLLLLVGCCPVTSVHPLPAPAGEPADQRLAGIWQLDAKDDKVFLHIARPERSRLRVVLVEHKSDGTLKQESFNLTVTNIGQQTFMTFDLEAVSDEQKKGYNGHIILKYALSDAYTLSLQRLDLDFVAASVESEQLAGEIEYDQSAILDGETSDAGKKRKVACARITSGSQDLAAFIAQQPSDRLFQPYLTFKRLPCVPLE